MKYRKQRTSYSREGNPHWKGGLFFFGGWIYVHTLNIGTSFNNKYIKRANLVWYEHTGEIIRRPFLLHHINGDKLDDRFENLIKVTQKEHAILHRVPRDKITGKFIRGDKHE